MSWPSEWEVECGFCQNNTMLDWTSIIGVYDGHCTTCGEWIEFNADEALASAEAERQIDARRDERWER